MSSFDIIKTWEPEQSFRVEAIKSQFTLQDIKLQKRFTGNIPIENLNWKIGLIVGRSGTGKSTIAKTKWPQAYIKAFEWINKNFVNDFPKELTTDEINTSLCNVGFASPPDWLKSYEYLSQGEKMRVDLARAILLKQPLIVFDEFTSVVDREIAKVSAFAISKAIRHSNKQFIAVTCHYDVEEWLQPDWTFYTDTMTFQDNSKKKEQDPKLNLKSMSAPGIYGKSLGNITI
jgi:ABC-type glutathione transport system ATPase component